MQDDIHRTATAPSILQYWLEALKHSQSLLELPTDHPRPSTQQCAGVRSELRLGHGLASQLRELCARHGVSLEAVLLAGFASVLSRYASQRDVTLALGNGASPGSISGFIHAELTDTFRGMAGRIDAALTSVAAHQPVPVQAVANGLGLTHTASHAPIAQACFAFLRGEDENASLEMGSAAVPGFGSRFDLTLEMRDDAELSGALTYSSELFTPDTIQRLSNHFSQLLRSAVGTPDISPLRLPLLSADEYTQIVVEWNATEAPFPLACVHELFEARVREKPDARAVVFGDDVLTYAQLNARANMLAHHLRARGVRPDVLVGVCATRSTEMVIALLGILKAGGAYVPLDPTYPPDRLRYMLEDARPSLLLSQEALLPLLPQNAVPVIWLDSDWPSIATNDDSDPDRAATPDALAYVIYTSGSTGRPKGVALAHRGLCNLCVTQAEAFQIDSRSQVLQFASISFDAAVSEAFVTLCQGACLHLVRPEILRSGLEIVKLMESSAITTVTLPPSLLAVLPKKALPALHTLVLAGEAWPADLATFWGAGRRMLNAYGPTEGTVCATWWELTPELGHRIPIGKPLPNVQVYILDEYLQPVPVGVAGELHIAGIGLARGYLNRPDLTAEKFIAHPFSGQPGARMYRTGDKARYLPDGNIEFLGRIDHQVKLRGYRIELGEVEAALTAHEFVKDAVVMVREDHPGEKRLVAYVIRHGDTDTKSLRAHLKTRLPDYMVPQYFVFVDVFPTSPNGKIDRKALPAPHSIQ